jgi:hypothetical protein
VIELIIELSIIIMNNKRKFPINNSNKLKKISLNVFDNDDDDNNDNNKNSLNDVVTNINSNGGNIIASIGNIFIKSNDGVVNVSSSSSTTTTSISLSSSSASALLSSSSSSESQLKQEQRDIITKTATWVINNNKDNITILLERSKDNPVLSFLFDGNNTIAGKYYIKELNRLQVEKHVQSVCSGLPVFPSVVIPSSLSASSSSSSSSSSLLATTSVAASMYSSTNSHANEKRNRWGPISDTNSAHTTTVTSSVEGVSRASSSSYHDYGYSSSSSIANNKSNNHRKGDDDFNGHYSDDDDNDGNQIEHDQRMEKLLREQKELQLLESRIRDAAKQNLYGSSSSSSSSNITEVAKYISKQSKNDNSTNNDNNNRIGKSNVEIHIAEQQAELYLERLAEYESLAQLDDDNYRDTVDEAERNGGVIEGGTWEHRKRAKEMLKTAAKNLELTLMVREELT